MTEPETKTTSIFCVICKMHINVPTKDSLKTFNSSGHDRGDGWSNIRKNKLRKGKINV